jgi:hypothetical protein
MEGKWSDPIEIYLLNDNSYVYNIVFSFVLGLIFSPFSSGGKFFIFYLLASQLLYVYVAMARYPWTPENALGSICASFMGFVIGRTIAGVRSPLDDDGKLTTKKEEDLKRQLQMRNVMLGLT